MNNQEIINLLLKVKQEVIKIEFDNPYHVWVFDNSSYSMIEDDITRLQEIACLELEKTKRAEQTKVTLLLTTDICWYSSVDDYFKALRLRIKNNKENIDENDAALTKKINQITTDAVEKLKIKKRSAEKTLTILEGLVFFGVSVWTMFVLYQFKDDIISKALTIIQSVKDFLPN
ncbi:TPA: hypothetical protein N3Z34_003361 [Klebsiella aerogenes]|nr:hypothetical protein [Klebsiella aerogenes]